MSAFDDAAREIDQLTRRLTELETQVRSLLDRREGPARTAYKPSEVAAMLGKNTATIREWIKDGRLPAEDLGGHYAIPASAVDAIGRRAS
jgi:excisionase family DNA binding protein